MIRADVDRFDELQDAIADATRFVEAKRILELGTGTGETSRRVLQHHAGAALVGIDESEAMLEQARRVLPDAVDLRTSRLQDPLPAGPFDLAFSALTVHHLDPDEKRDLFRRVGAELTPRGAFVLGDVITPERDEDAVTRLTEGFDLPDSVEDQLGWLAEAGFDPRVVWAWRDLAVIAATL